MFAKMIIILIII